MLKEDINAAVKDALEEIQYMITHYDLNKYIVISCHPTVKEKYEKDIKQAAINQATHTSDMPRVIIESNNYMPLDKVLIIKDECMKYQILVKLGIIKKNDNFADMLIRKQLESWNMDSKK